MSEGGSRSAKLHKQPEVDDDTDTISHQSTGMSGLLCKNICSIPTTNVLPASSSSSEPSPEDSSSPSQPTSTLSRKQTLTRTQAFEGTSPPPESLLARSDSGIVPSISTTSPPGTSTALQQVATHPLPNGTGSLPIMPDSTRYSTGSGVSSNNSKGTSSAQAKEFLLSSHAVSNDSGRGTLDDNDSLCRDSSIDASGNALTSASSPSSLSSSPYTDSTGTDLISFFKSTLRKSAKDKKTLLAVEKELIAFMGDQSAQSHKMNEMNPYDRMVAHRVAAYYGLDHNVDQSGKCIIVTRSAKTRMPDLKLYDLGRKEEEIGGQPKRKILLKKPASLDEKQTWGANKDKFGNNRAKSLEERQQNYEEVRERIFKVDEDSIVGNEGQFQGTNISSSHLLHLHHHPPLMSQQRSLDSMRDARPQHPHASFTRPLWSSTDSSGYGMREHGLSESSPASVRHQHHLLTTASAIPTSLSTLPGGYTGHHLSGEDSGAGVEPPTPPGDGIISVPAVAVPHPQGFHYNRSSPMANPLSANTAESVGPVFESPPSHPSTHELSNTPTGSISDQSPASRPASETEHSPLTQSSQYPTVAYLVSTDFSSIPPGSCIINPETMQPHLNPDGSLYHYDASCPPHFMTQNVMAASQSAPSTHIPPANMVYQEPVYDLTTRFAGTSLAPGESVSTGPDHMAVGLSGQTMSLIQSPGPTSNIIQAQYLSGSQVLGQPVRYIYTLPPGGHHLISGGSATGLDPNQQVTTVVPMPPAVGPIPGFPASASSYQVINPAYIQTAAGNAPGHVTPCIDLSSGFTFTTPDQGVNIGAGSPITNPQSIPTPSSHNVIQTYTVAPYPPAPLNQQQHQQQVPQPQPTQQQQQVVSHSQQQQSMSHPHLPHQQHQQQQQQHHHHISPPNLSSLPPNAAAAAATTFFTGVPLTNTNNSPSPLSQSQHHQLQQQQQQSSHHNHQQQQQPSAIVYNIGGVPMSPLAFPALPPTSTGASNHKSNPPQLSILPQTFQPSPAQHHHQPQPSQSQPPPPHSIHPQQSLLQQQHQQQSQQNHPQHQQQQPSLSSNGYHHPVTYSQPAVTFIPNQALNSQQGSQLVTIPAAAGSYHQLRPVGTIIPMPGAQGIVPAGTATPTHIQLVRPTGPIQDVRMMQPGAFHPRLYGPFPHQPRTRP